MSVIELILLAIGLAMDAFAVSICKGLSVRKLQLKHALLCGVWFGFFQFLMPVIGYLLGFSFQHFIESIDHWIAFVLLAIIGGNMIREAVKGDDEDVDPDFGIKTMFMMAIATSIDALAVGISFACLQVSIVPAAVTIGVITFVIAALGTKIGNLFGAKFKSKAEFAGGVILILIGLKVLLEHLGVIAF